VPIYCCFWDAYPQHGSLRTPAIGRCLLQPQSYSHCSCYKACKCHPVFEGRRLLIASQHKKEVVLSPLLKEALGVIPVTCKALDTDQLGTFTGEIERAYDPLTTARKKCVLGMELSGTDLAVASEGSFGPHPVIPFATAGDEMIILVDKKNGLEIAAREITTNTNFSGALVDDETTLSAFAEKALFPSHGLILSDGSTNKQHITKGISSWNELMECFQTMTGKQMKIYVESDMRAMFNPTRMKTIGKTCEKLIEKIKSTCPICQCPGFSVSSVQGGLPCSLCGRKTRSTLLHLYHCQRCQHQEIKRYPHQKSEEDPMYCDYCNP